VDDALLDPDGESPSATTELPPVLHHPDRMRAVLESMPWGFMALDADYRITYLNPEAARLMGRHRSDVLGRRPTQEFPDLEGTPIIVEGRRAREEGRHVEFVGHYEPFGAWIHVHVFPEEDGLFVFFRDVTPERQAQNSLRETEARFRALVEEVPAIVYTDTADQSFQTLYVSPQIEEILGFGQEEWKADPGLWEQQLHAEDRDRIVQETRAWLETGMGDPHEYRMIRSDGRVVWIHDRAVLVRDEEGAPTVVQGLMFDVTEQKASEARLRDSEERYRLLFEANPLPMWVFDLETFQFLAVNDAAVEHYGYSREEFLSRTILDIRPEEDAPKVRASMNTPGVHTGEIWRHIRKDGSTIMVEVSTRPIEFAGRQARLTLANDVTARLRAEEGLHRNMEALRETTSERQALLAHLAQAQEQERQRIAGDIHDDSIQKMTAVDLRLQAVRRRLTEPEDIRALDQLSETVRLALGRLRRLLFELRPPALDRDGLAVALRQYLGELAREGGFQFGMENRLMEEPPIEARTRLYRIAQEALTNVRKHAQATQVEVLLDERDGGTLVQIKDNGIGFSPGEAGSRALPGHLGLNSMQERAELARGWWRVDSAPGRGATVEFWLP
jgi:PAS domain S-box-containing protein